jgi:hypothetical protein
MPCFHITLPLMNKKPSISILGRIFYLTGIIFPSMAPISLSINPMLIMRRSVMSDQRHFHLPANTSPVLQANCKQSASNFDIRYSSRIWHCPGHSHTHILSALSRRSAVRPVARRSSPDPCPSMPRKSRRPKRWRWKKGVPANIFISES